MYDILSDFIYQLSCNILSFWDGITIPQKSLLFAHFFMRFKFVFCSKRMKEI